MRPNEMGHNEMRPNEMRPNEMRHSEMGHDKTGHYNLLASTEQRPSAGQMGAHEARGRVGWLS